MPAYASFTFPGGIILGVQRPVGGGYDHFGDPIGEEWAWHHDIGPCDVPVKAMRMRGRAEERARAVWDIGAPVGSDVRKADRIVFPAGLLAPTELIFPVIIEPEYPRNPWTGWQPFIHFQLEEVG